MLFGLAALVPIAIGIILAMSPSHAKQRADVELTEIIKRERDREETNRKANQREQEDWQIPIRLRELLWRLDRNMISEEEYRKAVKTSGFDACEVCKGYGEQIKNVRCYKCDGKGFYHIK